MVTILACKTKKDLKLFEEIPERLHSQDPSFIPPFPGSICKIFSPKSPFLKRGELLPFIAYKNGIPQGRIAAIVNRAHNQYYQDRVGFFGFFDSADDEEVAQALFDRAKNELIQRGCDVIRGPYSPTVNDECGLLVDGFETPPFVMMAYNPAYYVKLYDQLGLKGVRDLYAYYMTADGLPPEKVRRVSERVKSRSGITIRNIDMKRLSEELKIIQKLYNDTLKRNWGFVPIELDDLEFAAADLKAIVDPKMVMIAEKEGKPIGFSMTIPNINEFMLKAKKSKSVARVLKFAWLLKTKHPREARLAVLGVEPEYQNTGLAAVFYFESLMRGKANQYIGGELSWVEESNEPMIRSIEVMGGKRYKSYRIFEKPLNA